MTWTDDATCRGKATDIFFPPVGRNATEAKAICAACPVREACLTEALATESVNHRFGVRGGMTPAERDVEARRRRISGRQKAVVAVCGTDGGYHRHRRLGEPTCEDCRAAHSRAETERSKRRSAA